MFIGRRREINELKTMLETSNMEATLIYGRRRVGKTMIIREVIKDYEGIVIYYECKRVPLETNLKMLTSLFAKTLSLGNIQFEDFGSFFDFAFSLSETKKFVLIIDEFTFLLEKDFSIESFLASAIDMHKEDSKMKLIISGSYVGLIEKMLEYGSHSYGRFNHLLVIKPFDYFESSLFYPNYSDEDKFKTYAVFGGLPYFNSLINSSLTVEENIKKLIIQEDSVLENELEKMILEETSRIDNFNQAVSLIASGKRKQSDLILELKKHDNKDPKYLLNKMIEMDIIRKYTPINEKNNRKKSFFSFKDNFFDFYYRYIALSLYSPLRSNPDYFFDEFIKEDFLHSYLPKKFEEVSREFILKATFKGLIKTPLMDIGTYFFKDPKNKINREFDVVTLDKNGYISYECKYSDRPIDLKVIKEEEEQVKNLNIDFYKLGFISKAGFDEEVDKSKYNCFSLSDFYKVGS